MRILHLISGGDVGGAKTHVHLLLQGLSKTDHIRLVCFKDGVFAQEAAALGINTRVIDAGMRQTVSQLQALIAQEQFEVIHCHGSRANMIGMLLKRSVRLPVVTTVHSDYRLDYMGRPLAALTYGTINKLALRQLDDWIGVSDATVNMLISRKFDPQHVFKLYNSVSFEHLTPALSKEAFLEKIGLSVTEKSVIFGIAARISPVKDMETLIRAFAATVHDCPDARLIIAGDGEQRNDLEQLAAQLCPAGSYCFCGWLDDVDTFYHAIDVNMLTSVSEGFPYALPEGAKMHCATIASRVGGVPEFIEHEINGLLFTPKDVGTLTEYMLRLANSEALRKTFADRLFARTKEEFSIEAMLQKQRSIYAAVLNQYERRHTQKRDGIVLCGAYGKGNSGDEAILSVIVSGLLERDPVMPITVLSRKPAQTRIRAHVNAVHTFDLLRVFRTMRRSKLYLSGGGSLIQDATSTRSLLYYLRSMRDAKRRGCSVMMFSCGIGPVSRPQNRKRAAKYICKYVDRITLRDSQSLEELKRLGVSGVPVTVTADMALLLKPETEEKVSRFLKQSGVDPAQPFLLLSLRPWNGVDRYRQAFADAAHYAQSTYHLPVVLFAMEPKRDHSVCEAIARLIRQQGDDVAVLDAPEDSALCVGIMRSSAAVLSMRLHALIFAASQGVPCAGIAYDPKVSGFMKYIGTPQFCTVEEADSTHLCSLIDTMLENGGSSAEILQKNADENIRQAFAMLEK